MDAFRSFAAEGLLFPAFLIASGSAMLLHAPYRRLPRSEGLPRFGSIMRYLATRRWERRGGWTMVCGGVVIAALRLIR